MPKLKVAITKKRREELQALQQREKKEVVRKTIKKSTNGQTTVSVLLGLSTYTAAFQATDDSHALACN